MKGKIAGYVILFAIFLTIVFYIMPQNVVLAADSLDAQKNVEEELRESVDTELDRLDTDALQKYFESLSEEEKLIAGGENLKDMLKKLTNGEFEGFEDFFKIVFQGVGKSFISFLPSLVSVVIIAMLCGMMSGLSSGFLNKSTDDIVYFVCYGAIVIILLNTVINFVTYTQQTVDRITTLMEAIFPVLLTLMTALGGATSVGLYQPLMAVITTVIVKVISAVVIPCFSASIVFSVVGNISKNVKLEKFTNFFKTFSEWLLGAIFSLFMLFVTARAAVGITVDGIGISAAKFAISTYVPILGGYISDGFDIVMASCVLVKNSVGVTGLLLLLGVILTPILKIAVFLLSLRLASAVCEPLGDNKISDLLGGISKSLTLLVSALAGIGFMYFIIIMLVINTCNLGIF